MKKIFIVATIISIILTPFLHSQQWIATYNGSSNGDDRAYGITADSLGNVYMAGYTTNNSTGTDMSIIKLSSTGSLIWVKKYDGPAHGEDKAFGIVVDKALNVYITGYSTSINGKKDFTTIKYNSSGTQQWVQVYNAPSNENDEAKSIVLDDSSNVYVTGYITISNSEIYTIKYNKNGIFQWGQVYSGSGNENDRAYAIVVDELRCVYIAGSCKSAQTGYDCILLKYNSNGIMLWDAEYNGTANGDDKAYGIVVDRSNNIIMAGECLNTGSGYDYVTIKYNSSGEVLWKKIYSNASNGDDRAYGLVSDTIGNIYVTGTSVIDKSPGSEDMLTVKYNQNGNEMWTARYTDTTNTSTDIPYCLYLHPKKNSIYVGGSSRSSSIPSTENIIIIRYNLGSGSLQQKIIHNGTANADDAAYGIVVDRFSNVLITGYMDNIITGYDMFTAEYLNGELIGIETVANTVPQNYKLYQNYPNPFNPSTTIKFDVRKTSPITIKVFDITGKEISVLLDENLMPGTYELKCDFSRYASGIYFYEMITEGYRETKKMTIMK